MTDRLMARTFIIQGVHFLHKAQDYWPSLKWTVKLFDWILQNNETLHLLKKQNLRPQGTELTHNPAASVLPQPFDLAVNGARLVNGQQYPTSAALWDDNDWINDNSDEWFVDNSHIRYDAVEFQLR